MTFKFPVGPSKGRCNICGQETDLTENHVPPKAWAQGIALRVSSVADAISGEKKPRSHKMPNGVCFRSICRTCNGSVLSRYDKALVSMSREVTEILRDRSKVTYYQSIRIQPQLVARGVLGHMSSVGLNRYEERHSKHLFDDRSDLLRQVRLHYWVYPYSGRTVLRDFGLCVLGGKGSSAVYVLKAYPLAFAMVWNREFQFEDWQPRSFDSFAGFEPDQEASLPLEFVGLPGQVWPEHVQGSTIALLHSDGAFVAKEKRRG